MDVPIGSVAGHVAGIFDLTPKDLFAPGRYPTRVKARSVLIYWAVRELGMTAIEVAKANGLSQPAASMSVKRGEQIVKDKDLDIDELLYIYGRP